MPSMRKTVGATGEPRRQQAGAQDDVGSHYQQLHSGIMDNFHTQVRDRFKDHERLLFLALLDPQQFTAYRQSFPTRFSAVWNKGTGPTSTYPV